MTYPSPSTRPSCAACGTPLESGARFCIICGTPVTRPGDPDATNVIPGTDTDWAAGVIPASSPAALPDTVQVDAPTQQARWSPPAPPQPQSRPHPPSPSPPSPSPPSPSPPGYGYGGPPPGAPVSSPEQTGGARSPLVWTLVGFAAVAAVAVLIGGLLRFAPSVGLPGIGGSSSTTAAAPAAPTPQSPTVAATSPADPTGTSSATAATSATDRSADGRVVIGEGAGAGVPAAVTVAVLAVLDTYVAGVDARDYETAYGAYSAAQQARNPFPTWRDGVAHSTIEGFTITSISAPGDAVGNGPVTVDATFVSRQPAQYGPSPGETCSRWSLVYTLVPNTTQSGYLIDGAKPASGSGHTAC